MGSPVDLRRAVDHPTPDDTLAPECEICPTCGAPLCPCPHCHGKGVLIDFEDVGDPCDACRTSGDVCPNPECGCSVPRSPQ